MHLLMDGLQQSLNFFGVPKLGEGHGARGS